MKNDKVIIYENEEKTIEMYRAAKLLLEFTANNKIDFKVPPLILEELLEKSLTKLCTKCSSFSLKDKHIKCSSKVAILRRKVKIQTVGYEIFNDAIDYIQQDLAIGTDFSVYSNQKAIADEIHDYYKENLDEEVWIDFFKDFHGVNCSLISFKEDNVKVIFLKIENKNEYKRIGE